MTKVGGNCLGGENSDLGKTEVTAEELLREWVNNRYIRRKSWK